MNPPLPPMNPPVLPPPPNPPFPIPEPLPIELALYLTERGGEPKRLSFYKSEITIGRVQGNDIVLPKGNVNKQHARIILKDGKVVVVDLKSTNGTYVNGRKISSPVVVQPDDKIYIGDFMISLSVPFQTTPTPPPRPSRIQITNPALASVLNREVFVGRAFAFVSEKLSARPELSWLSLFGEAAKQPRVIPLMGSVELPGVKATGDIDQLRSEIIPTMEGNSALISGTFLSGASQAQPFLLERSSEDQARLTPKAQTSAASVLALDLDFPTRRANAVDPNTAQHPQTTDRLYQTAEKFLEQGQLETAKAVFEEARSALLPSPHPFYAYNIACCCARLNDKDSALHWLRTAISDGWIDMEHLFKDTDLASLRGYPPFEVLKDRGRAQPNAQASYNDGASEVRLFANTLILIGAFVDGLPWEGWIVA